MSATLTIGWAGGWTQLPCATHFEAWRLGHRAARNGIWVHFADSELPSAPLCLMFNPTINAYFLPPGYIGECVITDENERHTWLGIMDVPVGPAPVVNATFSPKRRRS